MSSAARPVGLPQASDWSLRGGTGLRSPGTGGSCVRQSYISLDPAMRGWLNDGRSYLPPVGIGEVMRAGAIGSVVASEQPDSRWATTSSASSASWSTRVATAGGVTGRHDVDAAPDAGWACSAAGLTAYFGLLDVGRLSAGETVWYPAPPARSGSIAGQIAQDQGLQGHRHRRGSEKCRWLVDELGVDAAIDYKAGDVGAAAARARPTASSLLRQRRRRDPRRGLGASRAARAS